VPEGQGSDVLLRNGARPRLEVASHPEYAAPERDSVLDLIAHDKAGERILEDELKHATVSAWLTREIQDVRATETAPVFAGPAQTSRQLAGYELDQVMQEARSSAALS
jgi:hypothetical protein